MAKTIKKETPAAKEKPAAPKAAASKKPTAPKAADKKKPAAPKAADKKKPAAPRAAASKKPTAPKAAVKKTAKIPETVRENLPEVKEVKEVKAQQKVEDTLKALYSLQQIDSQIDRIRIIRGELPLEVQDLEDEIVGLQTRVENFKQDVETIEHNILEKQEAIKNSQALIKRYEEQQMNVRNNREYDSLTKEIEFQNLEIQLAEKRINENKVALDAKKEEIEVSSTLLEERIKDLEMKKSELNDIVEETEKEERDLTALSGERHGMIESRLLTAYHRIRINARNGLAVVKIERDACGGCFNKIPPQHQLDIRMHKKIIVCEYCGRILVDDEIVAAVDRN
jgi:uncharacterized protein